jgi:FtsP/CotA-like multicopper oxidase with cupredoxin domain
MMDLNTFIQATIGQRILIRLINVGYAVHAIHTHGFHFQVIGSDGRKLPVAYEKDTQLLAPAERYDILIDLNQAGRYMLHDHIETAVTNDGEYMGGMSTFINVNNRDGSNPVPALKMNMEG